MNNPNNPNNPNNLNDPNNPNIPNNPNTPKALKYGNKICLFGQVDGSNSSGGYVGVYKKHNLIVLGPAPNYKVSVYTILPSRINNISSANKQQDYVKYGDIIRLIDENGNSWNTNTKTWYSIYMSSQKTALSGEIHISFTPNNLNNKRILGDIIYYNDTNISIDIKYCLNSKKRDKFNHRITCYKKSSLVTNGYLICDGSTGNLINFRLDHAKKGRKSIIANHIAQQLLQFTSQADKLGQVLRYGDQIKLYAISPYSNVGGYMGIYNKHNLLVLGPGIVSDVINDDLAYQANIYTITPCNTTTKPGDVVKYGINSSFYLINKQAQIMQKFSTVHKNHGYINLVSREIAKQSQSLKLCFINPLHNNQIVNYGDEYVTLALISTSGKQIISKIKNFKRKTSNLLGGYCVMDNSGKELLFRIDTATNKGGLGSAFSNESESESESSSNENDDKNDDDGSNSFFKKSSKKNDIIYKTIKFY